MYIICVCAHIHLYMYVCTHIHVYYICVYTQIYYIYNIFVCIHYYVCIIKDTQNLKFC